MVSIVDLKGCSVGVKAAAAAGNGGNGGKQELPGARRRFHLSPAVLERVLHAAFFVLGMGLMAPLTAILQTMDYLNIFFAHFYPSRTLYTAYNACNLLALVALFKLGDRLWPNKRSRMITGYSLYTLILLMLPLMDFVFIGHSQHMEPRKALQLAFTVWAVGASIAGFSDALISSVAYSQAASIGQRYTHAFVGGRATSGLVMAALRCVSKGALQQNMSGLRQSTSIYVLIAALIVLTAMLITTFALPRLAAAVEALNKPPAMPHVAHARAKQQQHGGKCTFCRLHCTKQQLHGSFPHGSAATADLLVTCKDVGGHMLAPGLSHKPSAALPIPPVGPPGASSLSTWGSCAPLLQQQSGALNPAAPSSQLLEQGSQYLSAAGSLTGPQLLASQYSNRRTTNAWSSRFGSPHSVGTDQQQQEQQQQHKQGGSLAQVVAAALPPAAEAADGCDADCRTNSNTSSSSSVLGVVPHSTIPEVSASPSSSDATQLVVGSPPEDMHATIDVIAARTHRLDSSTETAELPSDTCSSQPSTPPSSSTSMGVDADVVLVAGSAVGSRLGVHSQAAKDQHMVVYLQSYMAAARSISAELEDGLRCTCGQHGPSSNGGLTAMGGPKDGHPTDTDLSSSSSCGRSDSDSVGSSSSSSSGIGDSWWALFKLVWPFCLAVQPAPMTTATILPLNLSSQVANWPVAAVARWHVQIMMIVVQIGFFVGSALIPIRTPRRPRVTLLVMACCMFLFAPCFATALSLHARPWVYLSLALTMHTYSGYMTSTVFCVASQGFAGKDVMRVQQLLVLSMGVSYVVGSCVSWVWVFVGRG